jgi:hypothetical protein
MNVKIRTFGLILPIVHKKIVATTKKMTKEAPQYKTPFGRLIVRASAQSLGKRILRRIYIKKTKPHQVKLDAVFYENNALK